MGGHGARLPKGRRGSAQLGLGFGTGNVGFVKNKSLKDAIGEKGKPISIGEIRKDANPHFNPVYDDYSMNCQRCVVAYELNRRGYKVQAQETYDGDKLPVRTPYYSKKHNNINTDQAHWMGAFKNAKSISVGTNNRQGTVKNIETQMNKWGEGSRAIVRVGWNQGGGHVFNVEKLHGKIRYTDAQNGKAVDIMGYMRDAIPSQTKLVRTDNLRISNRAKEFVRKR